MLKNWFKTVEEWIVPCIIGVVLTWFLAMPAKGAENVTTETHDLVSENLYDMASLPRKIRKIVFRAATYGKRNEHRKAVDLLTNHLGENPDQDHYLLQLHLAQNLADLDSTALAREHYRKSVVMEPRLDRGWFGLADAAYDLEDFETAGDAFVEGYRVSPQPSAQVLAYAGTAYLLAELPTRAFIIFEELVSGSAGSTQLKWYQGLIVAAARMEAPQRADSGVRRMLASFPDDPEAWYLSYQHEAGQSRFREAAVALSVVGYLRPLTAQEQKQLGDLYLVAGVPYLASRRYAAGLADERSSDDYERLGSALVAAHETEQALNVLQEALAKEESPRLWSLLGDIHYLRQDYSSAREAFSHIADQDETGRAWLMQGYCALELGEKDRALDLLGRATTFPEQADMAQMLMQRARRGSSSTHCPPGANGAKEG